MYLNLIQFASLLSQLNIIISTFDMQRFTVHTCFHFGWIKIALGRNVTES
jgi:hypothetical protein